MSAVETIFLGTSALTFATGIIIFSINPWRSINRCYLIAALISANWLFVIYVAIHIGQNGPYENKQRDILFWLRVGNAIAAFLPCSFFLIKRAIIGRQNTVGVSNKLWPWLVASCLLAWLVFSEAYIPNNSTSEAPVHGYGYTIYSIVYSSLCIYLAYDAAKELRQCRGLRRLELKLFVINFCLSTLASLSAFYVGTKFNIPVLRYSGPFVVVAYFGVTLWSICYYRIFDARQVFAALGRRVSSLVALAGGIHLIDSYISNVVPEPLDLTISACGGGLIAVYWDRWVCRWLRLDAKGLIAAPRAQIIDWAREEADAGRLTIKFEKFLADWCHAETVSIYTIESPEPLERILKTTDYANSFPLLRQLGYITTESLSRRRPDPEVRLCNSVLSENNIAALIAVPRGSPKPSCVVAFGQKQSLRPYTHPDIELLIELIQIMDNILAHSRVAMRTAQIEKMESAAIMSRGLAHDLSNLATPVSAFLLHMETRVTPGTTEADVLADAKHSIEVMQHYIRESLFYARRLAPDFQVLSMAQLISSTLIVAQGRASARGVQLTAGESSDIRFLGDQALVLRLMQNLVFNGIDASPRGGTVSLSTKELSSGRITFSVIDQGSGVPEEIKERIFEPYFTTKDTGSEVRGLGLGLAISLKISGLHGGDLTVGRAKSGGAVFTFSLPAALQPSTATPRNPTHHEYSD